MSAFMKNNKIFKWNSQKRFTLFLQDVCGQLISELTVNDGIYSKAAFQKNISIDLSDKTEVFCRYAWKLFSLKISFLFRARKLSIAHPQLYDSKHCLFWKYFNPNMTSVTDLGSTSVTYHKPVARISHCEFKKIKTNLGQVTYSNA